MHVASAAAAPTFAKVVGVEPPASAAPDWQRASQPFRIQNYVAIFTDFVPSV